MWQRWILCWCIWNMHAFLNLKVSRVGGGDKPMRLWKTEMLLLAAKNTQLALLISIWKRLVSIMERCGLLTISCPRGSDSQCYKMLNIIFLYLIFFMGCALFGLAVHQDLEAMLFLWNLIYPHPDITVGSEGSFHSMLISRVTWNVTVSNYVLSVIKTMLKFFKTDFENKSPVRLPNKNLI